MQVVNSASLLNETQRIAYERNRKRGKFFDPNRQCVVDEAAVPSQGFP